MSFFVVKENGEIVSFDFPNYSCEKNGYEVDYPRVVKEVNCALKKAREGLEKSACPKCGKRLIQGAVFCGECGFRL